MPVAEILARVAAELALFAGVGFLLFGLNDLAVDVIYFARRFWRSRTVYRRYRRAFASYYVFNKDPGFIAIFVPAWDESAVIGPMLRAALKRLDYPDYRIFVGHYRNDPATAAAIASVADERVEAVQVEADGPTTKADCLNHLYDALVAFETSTGKSAKAVVLHDAEDVVHRYELRIFDGLIGRAAVIQLPVLPLARRPGFALDQRPLLRRVRRGAHQGTGRSRGCRRGNPARRGRLRDRPEATGDARCFA